MSHFSNGIKTISSLRIASIYSDYGKKLDPASIANLEQYELINNLYSTLVTYDERQQLVTEFAKSFRWEGESLVFEFSDGFKTVDGHLLSAEDAYFSLKRALFLGKTGHGDLRNILCPNYKIENILDPCPGIRFERNKLILTPFKSEMAPFLLPFLESKDFAIVPKVAMNFSKPNIPIIDHRNTSGAYYISEDDSEGNLKLKANIHNPKYSHLMPQEIFLIATDYTNAHSLLFKNEVDLIPTFVPFIWSQEAKLIWQNDEEFNIYKSQPLNVLMLCFTPKAMANFSPEQRLFAAKVVAPEFKRRNGTPESVDTLEFFQAFSDGTLDDNQKEKIRLRREDDSRPKFKRPIQLSTSSRTYEQFKSYLESYLEVEVVNNVVSASSLPMEKRLDMYLVSNDSAWTENLALLGYNLRQVFFLPNFESEKWIHDYILIEDKNLRMEKLKNLHYELLSQVSFFPIIASPYIAISRRSLKTNFLTFTAGSQFWRIRRED